MCKVLFYELAVCKGCGCNLGAINWDGLQATDEVCCQKCALKEFDL